ncbi:MAG: hypothetical protein KDK28_22285 [Maritimibacter sp.]|nr:hypothetical protein [Maritimibacter sp.]
MSNIKTIRDGATETAPSGDRLEAELRDLRYLLVRYQERIIENAEVLESQSKDLKEKERKLQDASARRKQELDALKAKHQAELAKLRDQRKRDMEELKKLRTYVRHLEGWYGDILESTTWRAMEPVRWAIRTARRQKKNDPFVPRTINKD